MRPPRIAHVVLSLRPGGLERLACQLAESTSARAVETMICCLDERGAFADGVERRGVRVEVVRRRGGLDLGLAFRLARFLRREGITVLHTHSLDPMLYGALAALLARVRIRIHTQHNTFVRSYGWRDRLKLRLAAKVFTTIVSVSAQTDADLARLGIAARKRTVVLNGVDDRAFCDSSAPRHPAARADGITVGTVCRLAPEKGLHVLLEAFRTVHDAEPRSRLVIAGEGPERSRLEGDIERLRLGSAATLAGHQSDVAAVLRGLDVFVLPSLSEGIPLALLEAMAARRPVVASAVGGVPEVLTGGQTGLLVPPNDPASLSDAIRSLLAAPGERERLGAAAEARVRERFGFDAMVGAYRWLYAQDVPDSLYSRFAKRLLRRLPARLMLWRGRAGRPEVAITFDDGPDAVYTPRILEMLARHDVKATFFVVGDKVRHNQDMLRRIVAEGHEVANHSYTHPEFKKMGIATASAEIAATEEIVHTVVGSSRGLFRPPKGGLSLSTLAAAWRQRMTLAMWTVDLKDFRADQPAQIERELAKRPIATGDVILYHGGSEASLAALPRVLDAVRRQGLSLVPMSRMLEA